MRRLRYVRRVAVAGAVATVTVLLAQNTTSASFTAVAGNAGNQVTAAGAFCLSPGTQTVIASADTTGYQSNPTTVYGANVNTGAISASAANARAFLRFALPAAPAHCVLTAASLRLYASTVTAGQTLDVYRVDPTAPLWTEGGLTWNTMPASTGSPVSSSSLAAAGWQTWPVTSLVSTLYTTVNNGFLVRDSVEGSTSGTKTQLYESRESASTTAWPQLVLTWG